MDWGLILCDDGAKGAYEIGVWKGLLEVRTDLAAVCAASASLVNGALIAQGDMDKALAYWSSAQSNPLISLTRLLADNYATKWAGMEKKALDEQLRSMLHDSNTYYIEAKNYLNHFISAESIHRSKLMFLLQTFSPENFEPMQVLFSKLSSSEWLDHILIGYFYPIFHSMDAGPTERPEETAVLEAAAGQKTDHWISVGFPNHAVLRWKKGHPQIQNKNVIPSEYIGLTLDTDQENILRKMHMGQLDVLRSLNSLSGKNYYLDLKAEQPLWTLFNNRIGYPIPGESGMKLDLLLALDQGLGKDETLEKLAFLLNRTTYKGQSLASSMLEITARSLHLPRLKRYTADEMIQEIFKTVNSLLSEHLETIKKPEYISGIFNQDPDNYLSMDPLSFLTAYVYFLSLNVHNQDILTKLTRHFNPETLLAITALLYLGQK